jgi:hypothetical protein
MAPCGREGRELGVDDGEARLRPQNRCHLPSSAIPACFNNVSQYARNIQVRPIWCFEDPAHVGHYGPGLVYNIQCQAPIRIRNCLFCPRTRSAPCITPTLRDLPVLYHVLFPTSAIYTKLGPALPRKRTWCCPRTRSIASGRSVFQHVYRCLLTVSYRCRSASPDKIMQSTIRPVRLGLHIPRDSGGVARMKPP